MGNLESIELEGSLETCEQALAAMEITEADFLVLEKMKRREIAEAKEDTQAFLEKAEYAQKSVIERVLAPLDVLSRAAFWDLLYQRTSLKRLIKLREERGSRLTNRDLRFAKELTGIELEIENLQMLTRQTVALCLAILGDDNCSQLLDPNEVVNSARLKDDPNLYRSINLLRNLVDLRSIEAFKSAMNNTKNKAHQTLRKKLLHAFGLADSG